VLACLATVDLGLALNQRMTIDAMVRAGVEAALADPGVDKVRDIVKGAAGDGVIVATDIASSFEVGGSSLSVDVVRSCACPESLSTMVSCTGIACTASAAPYVYYRISAAKYYDPIIIPRFPLRAAIQVEVK
jgi:pilus assembly protein CpaE